MKEVHYFYVPNAGTNDTLPDEEAQHAIKVLRLAAGDEIFLMDGCGSFYQAEVTLAANHKCQYQIKEILPQKKTWKGHLCLAVAPTKMIDRTEWLVEKATEIGVDEMVFLNCRFSERRQIKLPRIEKICISAVKQSRKAWVPELLDMIDFDDFVSTRTNGRRFIAHCYEEIPKKSLFTELYEQHNDDEDIIVMVGPEGDFSIDEVKLALKNGFESVSLGESRLRTETAGMVSAEIMQLARTIKRGL